MIILFLRYVIVYKKGYQEFQEPYSSVTTKVKGLSLTNLTRSGPEFPLYGGVHVWDSSDVVVPPEVQTFSPNHKQLNRSEWKMSAWDVWHLP